MPRAEATYQLTFNGRNCIMRGPATPEFVDFNRGMPGRHRWKDGALIFEPSRACIEYVQRSSLNIQFDNNYAKRIGEVKDLVIAEHNVLADADRPVEDWQFHTTPFQHQLEAFNIAVRRPYFGFFFEMGLGKTKTTLDVLAYKYLQGEIDRVVVIAPNGVHTQWVRQECGKHLPEDIGWEAYAYASDLRAAEMRAFQAATKAPGYKLKIFAFNVELLSRKSGATLVKNIVMGGKTAMVLDESQRIKTPAAARTRNIINISKKALYRYALSGTPITKGIEDLYAQMLFLSPDIFGYTTYTAFKAEFCLMGGWNNAEIQGYQNVPLLRKRLASHVMRATKDECLDIPPKLYTQRDVALTPEQKRAYRDIRDTGVYQLDNGDIVDTTSALSIVLRLQQVLSGFLPGADGNLVPIPTLRTEICADAVEEAALPTLVWCRFQEDVVRVARALSERGLRVVTYYGRDDNRQKEINKARFKAGEVNAMVGTAKSGGSGLDLPEAKVVVYYSNDFDAESRWQSEDRPHRIGQDQSVLYIDLIAPGTVDIHIMRNLRQKKSISDLTLVELRAMLVNEEGDEYAIAA